MTAAAAKTKEPTQQEACIDLPGETVQCWRFGDNIKVVLRKHRDVIFDLNLGKGKTYTVHATASDFYNARDKKLVYAKRRDVVTFRDGERLHLWVTRSFQGALVLKCDGETLMKLTPNEIDKHQYDNAPKTKPAPIIIALGAPDNTKPAPAATVMRKPPHSPVSTPRPSAAPIDEECAVVCVVEGTVKGMPDVVAEHFKKGGGKSIIADIDPSDVMTRNWIWGQAAGVGAYMLDNWTWLRNSLDSRTNKGFRLVTAKVHKVQGKVRFYFSGYSKYNAVFGPGGFGPGNERILNIFAGVGKTSSSFNAVAKGVVGTFAGATFVSVIFGAATSYAEWKEDIQKDRYDLAAALFMSVLKAVVVAALAVLFVAVALTVVMGGLTASVPVILVGAVTVIAGGAVSYLVDAADKNLGRAAMGNESNTDGLAAAIAPVLRKAGEEIRENWKYLMKKFPADYLELTF